MYLVIGINQVGGLLYSVQISDTDFNILNNSKFPEKLTRPQRVKNVKVFYGKRRFIAAITKAHHQSVS
jgi:hypothetical protein